jgi:hypothetical protein
MSNHQSAIDAQRYLHPSTRQGQVRASIKHVSGKRSNSQLGKQERAIADPEEPVHQAIAFAGNTSTNPDQRELRVNPIQRKECQAFCQGSHLLGLVLLCQKVFTAPPCELRNPDASRGSAVRTGETKFVSLLPK